MKIIVFLITLLCPLVYSIAHAETHALIMTISQYEGGAPPLKGVQMDGKSARTIAQRMGVKDENITELHDQQLTLEGMRQAFADLRERVQQGDSVFIYYSGHGGRAIVHDPEERCAEALVTLDGRGFFDNEVEAALKRISEKTRKIIVFLDACHSGGVTTRALSSREPAPFAAKFWSKGDGADACEKPVNVLTRSLNAASRSPGSGALNYVYIAAARDNEVSLDQPSKGGVATQAWLACINGEAKDLDGSGGITADEVRQCAQAKIDDALKNAKGYLPHHISITGNPDAVLSFAGGDAIPSTPSAPAVTGATNPAQTLQDIYNGRDDRRLVTLEPVKTDLRIGQDMFGVKLTSNQAGYVYLLMVGSDGHTFDILFPNQLDQGNAIEAGQTLVLPRSNWQITAQGPAGVDRLLAIVSDAPRNFGKLGLTPSGPFSSAEATRQSSRDIQIVSTASTFTGSAECQMTGKRNLKVEQKCSDAYGAAILNLREVN